VVECWCLVTKSSEWRICGGALAGVGVINVIGARRGHVSDHVSGVFPAASAQVGIPRAGMRIQAGRAEAM